MSNFKLAIVLVAALLVSAGQAHAQRWTPRGAGEGPAQSAGARQQQNDRLHSREADRVQNQTSRNNSQYGRRNRAPTPEQVLKSTQDIVAATGLSCQVTEANQVGVNDERQAVYEVGCATGPGYILIASTPPQTYDCIELKGQAEQARARDPNADVGQQCAMPKNLDTLAVLTGYVAQAGLTCTVDEGAILGKSGAGNVVYEVGCGSAPGYWLERQGTAWVTTDCLQIVSTGSTCRFTTAAEQAAAFQSKLADTAASDCQVTQVRAIGQNPNGSFYEAKCAAEGQGYIARIKDGVTAQVYACSIAQGIGGGCTLTPAPAAAPPATQQ